MLTTSEEYVSAIQGLSREDRITGTIKLSSSTTIAVSDNNIINNSVCLKEQVCANDNFEIGTFYTNELNFTLYDEDALTRSYADAKVTLKYGIKLETGAWEDIPLGVFTVDNSLTVRKKQFLKLFAFDNSIKFDIDINKYIGGDKRVATHIKDIAAFVGVELADTEFNNWYNNNADLHVNPNACSQIQTCRDAIEWLCALMGANARIDRFGKLKIIRFKGNTNENGYVYQRTIDGKIRSDTEFADLRAHLEYFCTTFDGIPYTYRNAGWVNDTMARNAILNIPENPLLKSIGLTKVQKQEIFANSVKSFGEPLRKVTFNFIGDPAIECFDTLGLTGGNIDLNRRIAIFPTKSVWKYRDYHQISCASAELTGEVATESSGPEATKKTIPQKVKSQTEKRIDGISNEVLLHGVTKKIEFTATGFNLTFASNGETFTNNFTVTEDEQGRITKIKNVTEGITDEEIEVVYND